MTICGVPSRLMEWVENLNLSLVARSSRRSMDDNQTGWFCREMSSVSSSKVGVTILNSLNMALGTVTPCRETLVAPILNG